MADVSDMIDRYTAKAAGMADLEEHASAFRKRLARVGVQEATILTVVRRRPAS